MTFGSKVSQYDWRKLHFFTNILIWTLDDGELAWYQTFFRVPSKSQIYTNNTILQIKLKILLYCKRLVRDLFTWYRHKLYYTLYRCLLVCLINLTWTYQIDYFNFSFAIWNRFFKVVKKRSILPFSKIEILCIRWNYGRLHENIEHITILIANYFARACRRR